jgi:hypothetical protein
VPLEPIVPSWGEELSLAVKLSRCLSASSSGDVEFADGWVRMKVSNDECLSSSDPSDFCPHYRVVKRIARDHCKSLAPNLSDSCFELRLVQTVDPSGGTMGAAVNIGIFGIIEDPVSGETYVMPLVNFEHLNAALNYLDAL